MSEIKYNSALTEREYIIAKMPRNRAYWYLKKEEKLSHELANDEIDRINRKVKEIEEFETRQIKRAVKINQAHIDASIKGSNELLIMSEV